MIWEQYFGYSSHTDADNRTIAVDFQDEATYFRLLHDGKAFAEFVLAFVLASYTKIRIAAPIVPIGGRSPR